MQPRILENEERQKYVVMIFKFQRPMALVDLDPDSWQSDYNSAERLHR